MFCWENLDPSIHVDSLNSKHLLKLAFTIPLQIKALMVPAYLVPHQVNVCNHLKKWCGNGRET